MSSFAITAGLYRLLRNANGAGDNAWSAGRVLEWASATDYLATTDRAGSSSLGRIPCGIAMAAVPKNGYGLVLVAGLHPAVKITAGTANVGRRQTSGATVGDGTDCVNAYDPSYGVALTASGSGTYAVYVRMHGGWTVATALGADPSSYNSSTNAEGYILGQHYSWQDRVFVFLRNANAAGDADLTAGDVVEQASASLYTVSSTRAAGSSLGRIPMGVVPVGGAVTKNNYFFAQVFGRHASVKAASVTVGREVTTSTVQGQAQSVANAYDWPFGVALTTVSGGIFTCEISV